MSFESGQEASDSATVTTEAPNGNGNGNGADSAARDLLFIEQLKFGQAELATESLFVCGLLHDSVATARRSAADRDVEIRIDRSDRVVSSRRGDRRRLIQAFDELIRNAVQYSPRGSTVEVRGMLLDRRYVIEIQDDGPGIPPEEAQLIYEAFFRGRSATSRGVPGRGIGLTVARAILEAHGGSLSVTARNGNGALVSVEPPA